MTVKQISIFVTNMTGGLAEVAQVIGQSGVDIRALSIADTTDFGILRIIVDDPDKAVAALNANGYVVTVTDVLAASIQDCPGGLATVLKLLADNGIFLEYVYAFATRNTASTAYVVLRVKDNDEASNVLTKGGVKLLSPDEIYNI